MAPQTYLIIGTSRGIGRELVNQLSQDSNNHIIASTRIKTPFDKPNVQNLVLEQTDSASVKEAAHKIQEIDTLIVNAAIGNDEKLVGLPVDRLQAYLDVNVVGVHRVINAFLPALRARKTRKIVIVSSVCGSITTQVGTSNAFAGPYALTKAANNMQAVQLHNELRGEGFTVVPLHPGWVATDMGNLAGAGAMPVTESVSGIVKVVEGLKPEDSGKFFQWDGKNLPW